MQRSRRRVVEATALAGILGGAPSATHALVVGGDLRSVVDYGLRATRAVGTLIPPGRPGLLRGTLAHFGISFLVGAVLARVLPRRHSALWGAAAGLGIGAFNLSVIGRRFPDIAALPLAPQLADNMAFGAVFALVVDRP
ncbi:MAG TPA: hypothetical protein VGF87_10445 [Acidimicrobiales bacterium]